MHEIRSNLIRGEGRTTLASKGSKGSSRAARESGLAGIRIKREEPRRSDQRGEQRHLNVVDGAALRYRGRTYQVPVLNVSSRGVMIASDLSPRIGARMDIGFAECNSTACHVRWLRDGRIGLEFAKETVVIRPGDTAERIVSGRREGEQHLVSVRRQRAPRHASMLQGNLHSHNGSFPVRLRNISTDGAMLQGDEHIDVNLGVVLEIPNGPAIPGRVVWSRSRQIGIRFDETFDLDELVRPVGQEAQQPDYLKPDYLRTETDPNSPWAARWSKLTAGDL